MSPPHVTILSKGHRQTRSKSKSLVLTSNSEGIDGMAYSRTGGTNTSNSSGISRYRPMKTSWKRANSNNDSRATIKNCTTWKRASVHKENNNNSSWRRAKEENQHDSSCNSISLKIRDTTSGNTNKWNKSRQTGSSSGPLIKRIKIQEEPTTENTYKQRTKQSLVRVENDVICFAFLRGQCLNTQCTKRHDIPLEATTADCSFFQRGGACLKDDCLFRHVKKSATAATCPNFGSKGYCLNLDCKLKHFRPQKDKINTVKS